jgi:glycerophosphoryl diester phosphodiesterase
MKIENCKWWMSALMGLSFLTTGAMAPRIGAAELKAPMPLSQAHAHNDYEHARPLLDALEHGFCNVEADVWLVNGQLLVAHDLKEARPERTLQALYLDPLQSRVTRNGGAVYRGGPPFTLLVDVKSDATNTYVALREALKRYDRMLTRFYPDRTGTNAVTVIISGNRARGLMVSETDRLAAYDGRLADLDGADSPHLIPLVSDNWTQHFRWRGEGPMPAAERMKLKQLVERTHQQGRRLRWWGTPDTAAMWVELRRAGVDLINADDLAGLQEFLLSPRPGK